MSRCVVSGGRGRLVRGVARVMVLSVVVGGLTFVSPPVSARGPVLLSDSWQPSDPVVPGPLAEPTEYVDRSVPAPVLVAPDPVRLSADVLTVDTTAAVGKPVRVGLSPLSVQVLRPAEVTQVADKPVSGLVSEVAPVVPVSLADGSTDGVVQGSLTVRVLSTDEAMKAGFDGVAFAVDPSAELVGVKDPVWLRFEIDWSALKDNYGAEWASRLQLLATDSCGLAAQVSKECDRSATVLPSVVNDVGRQVLVVEVELGAVTPVVSAGGFGASRGYRPRSSSNGGPGFGLSAGASSQYGNYAATSLAGSQRWSNGGNSGGFSWSYPMSGPSTPGGSVSTSLDYSSGAVDGLTADENTQGGQVGVGWSMPSSFIERRYKTCAFDGSTAWKGTACWFNDNAVISLNGESGELVKDSGGSWHLEADPGWRIRRFSAGPETQGSVGVDSNQEYWVPSRVVTTQDGTQYWFGFGLEKGTGGDTPGAAGAPGTVTKSVWTQPVLGNNAGEPCNGLTNNWCHQAYRWMLDRVVTATGVTSTYFYDTHVNTFGLGSTPGWATKYVAGGELVRIEYGQLEADANVADRHPAKIEFNYSWRCNTLNSSCPQPTSSNGSQFPDIPNDEICGEFATYCVKYAPTFFDWKVLNSVSTFRLETSGSTALYHKVDDFNLTTEWLDNDDEDATNANKLWLRSIQRVGWQGYDANGQTSYALPKIWFDSTSSRLANRSDYVLPTVVKQKYYRVDLITDELGGRTSVAYSAVDSTCAGVSSGWDTNTRRCYARYYNPSSGTPGFARWNKYVVNSITSQDLARLQPSVTTTYTYDTAGMGWHHNDDPMATAGTTTWDEYRGYNWVESTTGTGTAAAKSRSYFFRGMWGDLLASGTKTTAYTNSIGETVNDANWFRGRPYETQTKNATSTKSRTFTNYVGIGSTAGTGNATLARRVGTSFNRTNMVDANKWTKISYTYSGGVLSQEINLGDAGNAAGSDPNTTDDTCTSHFYTATATSDAERFIEGLEFGTNVVGGGAGCPGVNNTYISSTNTYYDLANETWAGATQLPIYGLVTRVVKSTSATAVVKTYATYEPNGFGTVAPYIPGYARPVTTTDARTKTSTITYTPVSSGAAINRNDLSIVTHDPISTHTTTTLFDNFGRAYRTTDANGRATNLCFDQLGRTTRVYMADGGFTSCTTGTPNLIYDYWSVTVTATPRDSVAWRVQSQSLFAVNGAPYNPVTGDLYKVTMAYLDGYGRSLQTQTLSPTGGRIVTRTKYDANGRPTQQSAPYPATGTSFVFDTSADTTNGLRDTVTTYDALGRTTKVESKYGTGSTVAVAHEQTTEYDDVNLATISHLPGSPTSTVGATATTTDVLGRTTAVKRYTNTGGDTVTTYTYTNTGNGPVVTSTDADSHVTTTASDWLGRVLSTDEPDQGFTAYTYYDTGQVRCIYSAKGQLRLFTLDDAGRTLQELLAPSGTSTCPAIGDPLTGWTQLSSFTYDPAGGIGATASATSYSDTGAEQVKAEVASSGAFDTRGRLVKSTVTVKAANDTSNPNDDLLEMAVTTEQAYTQDDQIYQTVYPGMTTSSNLPDPEIVTATFNSLGMPIRALSDFGGGSGVTYVHATTYDSIGRITQRIMGGTGSTHGLQRDYTYRVDDGRINTMQATDSSSSGSSIVQNDTYTYDTVGNPSKVVRDPAGTTNDETACYTYDARQRLTRAFVLGGTTGNCATTPVVTGGPAPFDESYTYDKIDRITTSGTTGSVRTYGTTGATVSSCSPGTDTTKPHAVPYITAPGNPLSTSGRVNTYDCNGAQLTDTNTTAGITNTYTWDARQRMVAATRTTPTATTNSTFAYDTTGQRVLRTETTAGVTTKTVYIGAIEYRWRSTTPTTIQALRTYSGAQRGYDGTLVWTAGDTQNSINIALTNTGTLTRTAYTPYGTIRTGTTTNDRGFLNQTNDPNTTLNYLNNRYQDPTTGIFLSVDPLVGKTGTPYLYANGNPTTLSDPTGLAACDDDGNCPWSDGVTRQEQLARLEAELYESAARDARVSEPQAMGFFIARVLDPFHDAVGIDIARRSGASFEIGCSVPGGMPDLCKGSDPKYVGELKYRTPWSIGAGKAQLGRYGGDDGVEVKRGVFGTSGSTRVGILVFDWQEDPEVDGLYTYKLNEWDLSALLAAMESTLAQNRRNQSTARATANGSAASLAPTPDPRLWILAAAGGAAAGYLMSGGAPPGRAAHFL